MKGAAAALAGALLFFLGVLTLASDGGRVPPPPAIPLGAEPASATADRTPGTAAQPPAAPAAGERDAPAVGEPAAPGGDPARPAGGTSGDPTGTPAGDEPPAAGRSGGVEEVTGQVDCLAVGSGQGDGACPPGQTKKIDDPPKDEKGDGDGKR